MPTPESKKRYIEKMRAINNTNKKLVEENQDFLNLPPETKEALLNQVKNLTKDKETGETDPLIKIVEQIPAYMPLIQQLLGGFRDAQNARQSQQVMQPVGPQPPQGWLQMTNLQRLARKYDAQGNISAWYRAGEAYEAQQEINPTQYVDASYKEVAPQRQQQISQQSFVQQRQEDLPDADESAPSEQLVAQIQDAQTSNKPNKVIEANEIKPEEKLIMEAKKEAETLRQKALADNMQYLNMAVSFINNMPNAELKKKLEEKTLFAPLVQFKALIPFQAKEMILSTTGDELNQLLKEKAPIKYTYIMRQRMLKDVKEQFELAKVELKA